MTHQHSSPEFQDHDPEAEQRQALARTFGSVALQHDVYGVGYVANLLEGAPEQQCPHLRGNLDLTLDLVEQRLNAAERGQQAPEQ